MQTLDMKNVNVKNWIIIIMDHKPVLKDEVEIPDLVQIMVLV